MESRLFFLNVLKCGKFLLCGYTISFKDWSIVPQIQSIYLVFYCWKPLFQYFLLEVIDYIKNFATLYKKSFLTFFLFISSFYKLLICLKLCLIKNLSFRWNTISFTIILTTTLRLRLSQNEILDYLSLGPTDFLFLMKRLPLSCEWRADWCKILSTRHMTAF